MTPDEQLKAIQAVQDAERLARIEQNWQTYQRSVSAWIRRCDQRLAEDRASSKAES